MKFSDEYTIEQLKAFDYRQLALCLVDQQFNYWYDPCGKSGDEFDDHLTDRSRLLLKLMYKLSKGK